MIINNLAVIFNDHSKIFNDHVVIFNDLSMIVEDLSARERVDSGSFESRLYPLIGPSSKNLSHRPC